MKRPPPPADSSASAPTRADGPRGSARAASCETAELALAARAHRTLGPEEADALAAHLATCARCRAAAEPDRDDPDAWRWLVRVPAGSLDEPGLPVMDPGVYAVERELASGGMGRVSLATDRRLGRVVALKEILDPTLHERFEREALITAHLQHPAIVPIYEAGTWPDGTAFYTMRLVEGTTLQAAIDAATSLRDRLGLLHHLVATVEAIAYAHGRGVLHRDLKTTNVLVGELGETVVIDWGLAKYLDDRDAPIAGGPIPRSNPDLTRVGSVMGTPGFMAPEQARGDEIDERADVFALGAMLYTLLAGVPPYHDPRGDGDVIMARTVAGPPPPIATLAADAPADLRAICERAMAHRAADRYRTAREMAAELRRFESGQLIARPYGIRELVGRWLRKHRAVVGVAGLALLAIATVGVLALVNVTRSRAAAEAALAESRAARTAAVAGEAEGFEEQARAALLAGDRERARQLVREATSRGRDTPATRYLTAAAERDRDLLTGATRVQGRIVDMLASPGERPLAIDDSGAVRRGDTVLTSLGREVDGGVFAADGTFVAAFAPPALVGWDITRKAEQWRIDDLAPENPKANADVMITADQALLALTTHADGTAFIIDARTGARRGDVEVPGKVTDLAFSPSGTRLAVIGDEGELVVVDTATAAVTARSQVDPATDAKVRFLDDQRLVVASGRVGSIIDLATSESIALPHDRRTYLLEVAPRAGLIVTATNDGEIRLWSAAGVLLALHQMPFRPWQLRFDPQGEQLAAGTSAELVVWRVPGFVPQLHRYGSYIEMRWDARGTSLVSGDTQAERVDAFAAPRANLVARFESPHASFLAGDSVVVSSPDRPLVIRTLRGDVVGTLANRPDGLWASSRAGDRLMHQPEGSQEVSLLALPTGTVLGTYPADQFALSPDGRRAVLVEDVGPDDTVKLSVIDATTGKLVVARAFALPEAPVHPAFLVDSSQFLIGRLLKGWEAWATDSLVAQVLPTDPVTVAGSAYPSDIGTFAVYGRYGGLVTIHDARAGGRLIGLAQPRDYEDYAVFSGDGQTLVVQNEDGTLEVFDVGWKLAPRATIRGVNHRAFALSQDGSLVFTGHPDGAARVWDGHSGRLLDVMHAHWRSTSKVWLSPDGRTLLVDSRDGFSSLWDVGLGLQHHRAAAVDGAPERGSGADRGEPALEVR